MSESDMFIYLPISFFPMQTHEKGTAWQCMFYLLRPLSCVKAVTTTSCNTYLSGNNNNNSSLYLQRVIVRPVKRDWEVLSKDTPLDISI